MNDKQKEEEKGEAQEEPAPDLLERIASWISMLLLLGAAGFLIWEGRQNTAPPDFRAQVQKVWTSGGRHYVQLRIQNTGGKSVQNLDIQVALKENGQTIATSGSQLSWLPSRSTRQAVVIFEKDPRLHQVKVSFKGYENP